MTYTSIEQANKLLELGLDPKTADMVYEYEKSHLKPVPSIKIDDCVYPDSLPCWSGEALLNILPDDYDDFYIAIRKNPYQIAYGNSLGLDNEWHDAISSRQSENLADACYHILLWFLKKYFETCTN